MNDSVKSPRIVVLGNEKGGTGKSTLAIHVIVHLLYSGKSVTSVDMDGRQGTLSRYLENREIFIKNSDLKYPVPTHFRFSPEEEYFGIIKNKMDALISNCETEYIIIDSKGSDNEALRYVHERADVVVTPMNDSYIDLDLLVKVDNFANTGALRPSIYAEMLWEQKLRRASTKSPTIEWFVVRNRMQSIVSKSSMQIEEILIALSKRFGFKLVSGFRERSIFRELFPTGLTLLDKREGVVTTLSHVSAKQELRTLVDSVF